MYQMAEAAYGGQYKNKDGKSTTYSNEKKEQQIQEVVAWTIECIARNDIITIFDIRRWGKSRHLIGHNLLFILSTTLVETLLGCQKLRCLTAIHLSGRLSLTRRFSPRS